MVLGIQGKQEGTNNDNDTVGVMDEYGHDIVKAQIENLKIEIGSFERNIEQFKKDYDNFKSQWDVDEAVFNLMISKGKKLKPDYEFEADPKYWELRKKQIASQYRHQKFLSESKLKTYTTGLEANESELKSAKKKLEKLTKKLGK